MHCMKTVDLIQEEHNFLDKLKVNGKSFNTLKNYKTDLYCFNKYLVAQEKDLHLTEFTTSQVQEYNQFLNSKYNSPNSIRRRVQALRLFFDYLVEHDLYFENPIKKAVVAPKVVDIPRPASFKTIKALFDYLTQLQENALGLEKLLIVRNKILFYLIYGAGLKVSDIAILDLEDLMGGKEGKYRIMISHPKRDPYTVALPEGFNEIYPIYKELLERQKNKDQIDFTQLLFNSNPYKILAGGLSPRGIEVLFKDFGKKLNDKITAKHLRQACIFKWLIQDKPQASIKKRMDVQPQYSLKPYTDLLESDPADYLYIDISEATIDDE